MHSTLKRRLGAAGLALAASAALAGPAQANLAGPGPTGGDGYPTWYQDATGTQIALCGGAASCPAVGAAPFEDFYAIADADFSAVSANVRTARFALEATDGGGGKTTFGRIRFRIDNLVDGAQYRITHPWGTRTLTATGGGINDTVDIGDTACVADPCNFNLALGATTNPFLRQDPADGVVPAGFLGDFNTPHKVVGSPTGHNYVQIDGPGVGGPTGNSIRTDDFFVTGKLNGAEGPLTELNGLDRGFGTLTLGQTQGENVVIRNVASTVAAPITGAPTLTGASAADYKVTANDCPASLPVGGSCTVTVTFTPSAAGSRTATLNLGTPAGSTKAVTLSGTGVAPAPAQQQTTTTTAPAAAAPVIIRQTVTPIAAPAAPALTSLSLPSSLKLSSAKARGITLRLGLTAAPKVLVRVLRGGHVIYTRTLASGRTIKLNERSLRRKLKVGRYSVRVTPVGASGQRGATTSRQISIRR